MTTRLFAVLLAVYTIAVPGGEPRFVDVALPTGLDFTHVNGASGRLYIVEEMGAGLALFDYDNDGDLDVFCVQGGPLEPAGAGRSAPGREAPAYPASRLFRNDLTRDAAGRPRLHFTDVTATAGVGLRAYGMGAAVGDYDNDGDLDLFVTTFGPDTLYRNNGDGTFTDVTATAGVSDELWSTSATFFDYDRDGDLDLFVANYLDFALAASKACTDSLGAPDYCGPRVYNPVPDKLYRNDGNGRFTNVSDAAGITKAYGAGLGVVAGDYNSDGWLDLYVANDARPNQLWINRHDGTFVDEGLLSGSAVNAAGNAEGSMGIASDDLDNDGDEDLFITNIVGETFVLYRNDAHAVFEDARATAGIGAPTGSMTGFGTGAFDYDNDGWLDLFVANGGVNTIAAQRGQPLPLKMTNQLFHNDGRGRFVETSATAGEPFARLQIGRGAAFGDVDNDGDVDLVVTTNSGPVQLLLNQTVTTNHWLQIAVRQEPANRFGMGARVGVEREGKPTLWRRVHMDGSYLSSSDARLHVGLGDSAGVNAVTVEWPDGTRERWTGVAADRLVELRRGKGVR
jgi:hypothetical protein